MATGILKTMMIYVQPLVTGGFFAFSNFAHSLFTTYPFCSFSINNEPVKVNYVEFLEGDLGLASLEEFPNGVNFYIDKFGNLVSYTNDDTYSNFSIDELGNLLYTD